MYSPTILFLIVLCLFPKGFPIIGIEHQLKKVKIPVLSALALSACLTFLKPVLNLPHYQ